jgi:hypothetical protein
MMDVCQTRVDLLLLCSLAQLSTLQQHLMTIQRSKKTQRNSHRCQVWQRGWMAP